MSRIKIIGGLLAVFVFMACVPAFAQNAPAPDDPLTISNIIIDKTDKNAVVARDAAILEAKRTAFQKLAERNLSPEDLKTFTPPPDQTVSRLVQDFEITSEQLSATRYVANFTVRFLPSVNGYLKMKTPVPATAVATAAPKAPGTTLVLPYYENMAGRRLLWEDGNAWLSAWKAAALGPGVTVPLGDASDMSAGASDAVWADNYGPVEKLRAAYGAADVVLAVANKSGPQFTVDVYIYSGKKLAHDPDFPLQAAGADEFAVFKSGVQQVLSFLKKRPAPEPKPETAEVSPAPSATPSAVPDSIPGPGPVTIEAEMNFDTFGRWVDAQKRLSSVTPPVKVEIKSISSGAAAFTLDFGGSMAALRSALADKKLALAAPAIEVDESVLGSTKQTQRPVYELQLVN